LDTLPCHFDFADMADPPKMKFKPKIGRRKMPSTFKRLGAATGPASTGKKKRSKDRKKKFRERARGKGRGRGRGRGWRGRRNREQVAVKAEVKAEPEAEATATKEDEVMAEAVADDGEEEDVVSMDVVEEILSSSDEDKVDEDTADARAKCRSGRRPPWCSPSRTASRGGRRRTASTCPGE